MTSGKKKCLNMLKSLNQKANRSILNFISFSQRATNTLRGDTDIKDIYFMIYVHTPDMCIYVSHKELGLIKCE